MQIRKFIAAAALAFLPGLAFATATETSLNAYGNPWVNVGAVGSSQKVALGLGCYYKPTNGTDHLFNSEQETFLAGATNVTDFIEFCASPLDASYSDATFTSRTTANLDAHVDDFHAAISGTNDKFIGYYTFQSYAEGNAGMASLYSHTDANGCRDLFLYKEGSNALQDDNGGTADCHGGPTFPEDVVLTNKGKMRIDISKNAALTIIAEELVARMVALDFDGVIIDEMHFYPLLKFDSAMQTSPGTFNTKYNNWGTYEAAILDAIVDEIGASAKPSMKIYANVYADTVADSEFAIEALAPILNGGFLIEDFAGTIGSVGGSKQLMNTIEANAGIVAAAASSSLKVFASAESANDGAIYCARPSEDCTYVSPHNGTNSTLERERGRYFLAVYLANYGNGGSSTKATLIWDTPADAQDQYGSMAWLDAFKLKCGSRTSGPTESPTDVQTAVFTNCKVVVNNSDSSWSESNTSPVYDKVNTCGTSQGGTRTVLARSYGIFMTSANAC